MSNFSFIPYNPKITATGENKNSPLAQINEVAKACKDAENRIYDDPRAACFHTRRGLELTIHWLFRFDKTLVMPYDHKLSTLLHDNNFKKLVPSPIWQKARVIQMMGNKAVHESQNIEPQKAMQLVKELHHIVYWLLKQYAANTVKTNIVWDDTKVPQASKNHQPMPLAQLQELETTISKQQEDLLKKQKESDEKDAEIQALKAQIAQTKAQNEKVADTHDYNEAETRKELIDLYLMEAGWNINKPNVKEYPVTGMPNKTGKGNVDYVLWGDDGKPLAVVEAKKTTKDARAGKQQAKLYADCIEKMHGVRPIIFYTNGYETFIWDDAYYPERQVAGFYKKDELASLITRRANRIPLTKITPNSEIAGRAYQTRAIRNIFKEFEQSQRKALLVMATGTGKTRTSIALIDALQRAGWVKRALFLADRTSLVNQAIKAFKENLPESSPVNLITDKNTHSRIYACTYQTMLNLINKKNHQNSMVNRFGVGHFDLIIIDEAHRSVYQKYKAIFEYFDSLLVGLTATPREEVDKNTYRLFDLEEGVPTDAYELEQAVKDGYLVPPKGQQIEMKFPRTGIKYNELSESEQEAWENIDWGDNLSEDDTQVNASAINNWLFNADTVDKMLKHLLQHGYKVDAGDKLAKTIIFARNHKHALFIAERFDKNYPQYAGKFARVIDNYESYAQSLIDDFSKADAMPQIAISVDMLDTGIDVPEVANLVFFKPVYSKINFGR